MKYAVFFLLLLGILAHAESRFQCDPHKSGSSPDKQRTIKFEKNPSVVQVNNFCGSRCSGVVVAPGLIMTAAHCMKQSPLASVRFFDDSVVPGRVVAIGNPDIIAGDIALILVSDSNGIPPISVACSIHEGEHAHINTIGGIDGPDQQRLEAKVVKVVEQQKDKFLLLVSKVDHGDSGAPVLNEKGELIGLVSQLEPGDENVGKAVPLDIIREVLGPILPKDSCKEINK